MIPVWRLREHVKCPRRNYFDEDPDFKRPLLYEVALRRGEALRGAGSLERESVLRSLEALVERAREDYVHIWGEEPEGLPEGWVDREATSIRERYDDYTEAVEGESAEETAVVLTSESLGLSGRLDKINGEGKPVVVRMGKPPDRGVWREDRAQLTAYCLLLTEKQGVDTSSGAVDYAGAHEVRPIEVRPGHRRRVLEIRDELRKVLDDGFLPRKRNESLCPYCQHEEACRQEPTSLKDRFFG